MRVLLVSNAGGGHLRPLLPLGRALRRAKHDVALVVPGDFSAQATKAGFEVLTGGLDTKTATRLLRESTTVDHSDIEDVTVSYFAGIHAPAMARDLVRIFREWRPDVVVHEEGEYATPVAASAVGVPYACQSWGPMRPLALVRRMAHALQPLWERWERAPGPHGGLLRYLYLDVCPPIIQHPDISSVEVAWPVQSAATAGTEPAPAWIDQLGPGPNIFVTLGSAPMFNRARDVFRAVVEGLAGQPGEVVVAVGRSNDPAAYGRQPSNVRIERFIPQDALLPHCDLVIHNGGAPSLLAALGHGLPILVLPRGTASQERNAEALVRGGVGLRLAAEEITAAEVARCVRALLVESRFREQAAKAERQIESMPPVDDGIKLLDRLARDRRPLPRSGR